MGVVLVGAIGEERDDLLSDLLGTAALSKPSVVRNKQGDHGMIMIASGIPVS
jgi:hypothetical protein